MQDEYGYVSSALLSEKKIKSPGTAPGKDDRHRLFMLCFSLGFLFITYLLLQKLFAYFLKSNKTLLAFYTGSLYGNCIIEAVFQAVVVFLPFFIGFLVIRKVFFPEVKDIISYKKPADGSVFALVVLSGLALIIVCEMIAAFTQFMIQKTGVTYYTPVLPNPETPGEYAADAVVTAVFPAVIEEFAFRGVVLQTLRRYGDRFAIFSTALIFGCMHGNIPQILFNVLYGLVLGYAAVITNTIWASMSLHFINNFFIVTLDAVSSGSYKIMSMVYIISAFVFLAAGISAMYTLEVYHRNDIKPMFSRSAKYSGTCFAVFITCPTVAGTLAYLIYTVAKGMSVS